MTTTKKHWLIVLKNAAGKTKTIKIPGGLSEPEAVRNACLKHQGFTRLAEPVQLIRS